jgi:hypothetical protein
MAPSKGPSTVVTAGLPDDPLVEILSRVPAKSLCRFKCVSKAWRDLITDPIHRKKLPQAMEGLFFMEDRITCAGARGGCEGERFSFVDLTARSVPLDIDPCFSFLTEMPGLRALALKDSCNGLLLFEHRSESNSNYVFDFIVCNPTTKQWGAVPTCGCPPPSSYDRHIYLAFDPAISSHFHLVQFHREDEVDEDEDEESYELVMSVHAYSSESGTWIHSQTDWDEHDRQGLKGWDQRQFQTYEGPRQAFVNGMLHLMIWDADLGQGQILVADVKGKTQRVIPMPMVEVVDEERSWHLQHDYIAQSQGRLHYFNEVLDLCFEQGYQVSIWVLQDYDSREWVFKHHVSCLKLGKMRRVVRVVAIHQNCNVVFFVEYCKLIAYDMESKEVRVFDTSKNQILHRSIAAPYVPCFLESPVHR